jgi:hypothetical protein
VSHISLCIFLIAEECHHLCLGQVANCCCNLVGLVPWKVTDYMIVLLGSSCDVVKELIVYLCSMAGYLYTLFAKCFFWQWSVTGKLIVTCMACSNTRTSYYIDNWFCWYVQWNVPYEELRPLWFFWLVHARRVFWMVPWYCVGQTLSWFYVSLSSLQSRPRFLMVCCAISGGLLTGSPKCLSCIMVLFDFLQWK